MTDTEDDPLIERRMAELAKLEEDLDSYGAPPVSEKAIATATRLAKCIFDDFGKVPNICPLSSGGVSLGWWSGQTEIELEIDDDKASAIVEFPLSEVNIGDKPSVLGRWTLRGLSDGQ